MTSTSPPPLHGSHARAHAIVRVDTPGGRVEQPCDNDAQVERVRASLLNLVAADLRAASTVTIIRNAQPEEETSCSSPLSPSSSPCSAP